MISTGQILAAGVVTGIAVGVAASALRWPLAAIAAAALSSLVLIVVWRAISNLAGLNGDFVPAVSVGDTVCLVAGALGPAVVAYLPVFELRARRRADTGGWSRWLPALVGGVVGFLVNVIIL